MSDVNIDNIIHVKPLTKLSDIHNKKLLNEIHVNFTQEEEKTFINNYYQYLNHDKLNDFLVNFDILSIELGYKKKENSEKFLLDNFKLERDYVIKNDTYMLNINCFKLFCIKSTTKKSNETYEYYMRLEELLYKMILEENNELKVNLAASKERNNELKLEVEKKEKINLSLEMQLDVVTEINLNKYRPKNFKFEFLNLSFGEIIPSIVEKITNNIQTYRMII